MDDPSDNLSVSLFSEVLALDNLMRNRVSKALPKGMELSHVTVLNHLANAKSERTPAQLAKAFNLTRGAMTNTLAKLEWAGHITISPDWDDARRKLVVISPAGRRARDTAMQAIAPLISESVSSVGTDKVKTILPVLRQLRTIFSED